MPGICALILLEGETEEEFYSILLSRYATGTRKSVKNLHGNFNINSKIADRAFNFRDANPEQNFKIYVCIDQERIGIPAFDQRKVENALACIPTFKGLFPVITILTIESIFFLDIDGIYAYLRAPKSRRQAKNYANFRKHNHISLSKLFKQFGKEYCKGRRCAGLVSSLDLEKMAKAPELTDFINKLALEKVQSISSRQSGKGTSRKQRSR